MPTEGEACERVNAHLSKRAHPTARQTQANRADSITLGFAQDNYNKMYDMARLLSLQVETAKKRAKDGQVSFLATQTELRSLPEEGRNAFPIVSRPTKAKSICSCAQLHPRSRNSTRVMLSS
eukprot:m.251400 g.251400  ORF g.251400 m.251400 type:complete len:122 (-) comp26695_c0_seq20:1069-1434(-)